MKHLFYVIFFLACIINLSHAGTLSLVCWNVERGFSPDANPYYIAYQVSRMGPYDLWGFSEASDDDFALLEEACEYQSEADFMRIEGSVGDDHLLVVFDTDRLELLEAIELTSIKDSDGETPFDRRHIRPPLGGRFLERESGAEFYFLVNHFHRGDAENRRRQSDALSRWALSVDAPVIASGDFNFDFDIDSQKGNTSFDIFLNAAPWRWARPAPLVKTQSSPRYNSVLDFIFLLNSPAEWAAESQIVIRPGDLNDDEIISDHRPVKALIHLN